MKNVFSISNEELFYCLDSSKLHLYTLETYSMSTNHNTHSFTAFLMLAKYSPPAVKEAMLLVYALQ